ILSSSNLRASEWFAFVSTKRLRSLFGIDSRSLEIAQAGEDIDTARLHAIALTMIEALLTRLPRGAISRVRLAVYRLLGMKQGHRNRMEGGGRCRRLNQIEIGSYNAFSQGCWLWPLDETFDG